MFHYVKCFLETVNGMKGGKAPQINCPFGRRRNGDGRRLARRWIEQFNP
jgi:hypothetical protein